MAKIGAEQAFRIANGAYESAKGIIRELSELAQASNPKFRFEVALRQYDWILQATLLTVAVQDGTYHPMENAFIRRITDEGDILKLFNDEMRTQDARLPMLTWDNFKSLLEGFDEETRKKLMDGILLCADRYSGDFVKWFAPIDAADARDYLAELDRLTAKILVSFSATDGEDLDDATDRSTNIGREVGKGLELHGLLLSQKWRKMMNG